MQTWGFLKNKAMVASLGAVMIFGIGATVAVSQLTHHPAPTGQANTANATNTATGATTTSAAATDTATSAGANPTATAIPPTPTTQPQPTPTNAPSSQQGSVQGTILNVYSSSNNFTVQTSSGTKTVFVNGQTHYQGSASSLAGLKTGWQVEAQGYIQSDGSLLATDVNSDNGA